MHAAVAQQVHVIDRTAPATIPATNAGTFKSAYASRRSQADLPSDQPPTALLGQCHHGSQSGARHEIGVVENWKAVRDSHLSDVLLIGGVKPTRSPIVLVQEDILTLRRAASDHFTRWMEGQAS
jgi:hypothetical protein